MKYFSMFSGIAGFEKGIEQALGKAECVGFSEIDKYAIQVYLNHYPDHRNYGDCTTIIASELPDFDLLVGGFPCQSFSVAGKRRGFEDTRGTLFFDIARILKEKKPQYLLLENVKGLLSHDQGRTFEKIIGILTDIGYSIEWQVLNSKDFGVPQNRERVFIVGHSGKGSRRKIFPFRETSKSALEYVGGISSDRSKKWLDNGKELSRNFPQGSRVYTDKGISSTLASQAGGLGAKTGLYMTDDPSRKKGLVRKDIAPTLRREAHGNLPSFIDLSTQEAKLTNEARALQARYNKGYSHRKGETSGVVIPVLTPDRAEKRQNGRRFKTNGEPSFTLTGQDRHGVLIKTATEKGYEKAVDGDSINYSQPNSKTRRGRVGKQVAQTLDTGVQQGVLDRYQIRRLTPTECERLQGFPDGWTEGISDTQRYKCLGNAVTVNVIEAIISKIFHLTSHNISDKITTD